MKTRKNRSKWIARFLVIVMLVTCLPVYQGREAKAEDYRNNGCVRWVKAQARQKLGIQLPGTGINSYGLAGASGYWKNLPSQYKRGSEPASNALAIWQFSSSKEYKYYGHVAYVENVNGIL